ALAGALGSAAAQTDAELRERLIGPWAEERSAGCSTHRQQVKLQADGRFEANGVLDDCGKVTLFVWRGTWDVRGYRFVYTTTHSNAPDRFPVGARHEDEILSVSADEWVMLEQAGGQRSVARRVK
ncbi:MAG: hypothetical protein WAQ05_07345, partial [Rubrivivax sp.]